MCDKIKQYDTTLVSLNTLERTFWNDKLNYQRYNKSEYMHSWLFNKDNEEFVQLKMKAYDPTFDTKKKQID